MAENLNHIDTIEAYLRGKLDSNELDKFEQQLNADPNLKNEVEFQQSIQDGLLEARRLELKQRLNSIKIEPAFEWTIGKIAAGVAMVGLLGLGASYLLKSEDKPVIVAVQHQQVANPVVETEKNKAIAAEPILEKETTIVKVTPKKAKKVLMAKSTTEELAHSVDFQAPVIPMEQGFYHVEKYDEGKTPNGKIEQVGAINISSLTVDVEKSLDKFHYKYFSDKLILVGDFSKGPYELIELNKNQEKNLYLYYDGAFYELHYGTESMDHLVKITQCKLQNELLFKIKK